MGYSTRYSLSVELLIGGQKAKLADDAPLLAIIEQFRAEHGGAEYALDKDGATYDSCKWYEHEDDLRAFSTKYPNVLFTLHGEGEENEDIWDKYFLNGKCQVAKAEWTIPPFDPTKL